jgi:hypothetical protein
VKVALIIPSGCAHLTKFLLLWHMNPRPWQLKCFHGCLSVLGAVANRASLFHISLSSVGHGMLLSDGWSTMTAESPNPAPSFEIELDAKYYTHGYFYWAMMACLSENLPLSN